MPEFKCKSCGVDLRVSIIRTTVEDCPVDDDGQVLSDGDGETGVSEATVECDGPEWHSDKDTGYLCKMDDDGDWKLVPVTDQPTGKEATSG